MKAVSKFAVLISLVTLASVALRATTDDLAYLESCRKAPGVPVPVTVVTPTVGPEYAGATLQLEFVVDATGKPVEFSVMSAADDTLATAVIQGVRQWRFIPVVKNGLPVATKVSLPIKIVNPSASNVVAMK